MLKTFSNSGRVLLAAILVLTAAQTFAAGIGRFQFVVGDVSVADASGRTRQAVKGDELNEGDTVGTGSLSSAQLRMVDGAFVAVRPDSKLKFDQYRYNGKEDGTERGLVSLLVGGFRSVTGVIGRTNKANYSVATPTATIGIRGTDYETVHVRAPGETAEIKPVATNWPLPSTILGNAVSAEDLRDAIRMAQAYSTKTDVDMPFLLAQNTGGGLQSGINPGTYTKTNLGATTLNGTPILAGQAGFANSKNVPGIVVPINNLIFTATLKPGDASKRTAQGGGGTTGGGTTGGGTTGGGATAGGGATTGGDTGNIRNVSTVDTSTSLTTGGTTGGTGTTGTFTDTSTSTGTGGTAGGTTGGTTGVVQNVTGTGAGGQTLNFTDPARSLQALASGTNTLEHLYFAPVILTAGSAGLLSATTGTPAATYSLSGGSLAKIAGTPIFGVTNVTSGTIEVLSGATAKDAFLTDPSIQIGRWEAGSYNLTPTGSTTAVTIPLGTTANPPILSAQWMLAIQPGSGIVQAFTGTTSFNMIAATSPTDALGNVGTLNSATLSANFTAQTVDAGVNLTIASKTLGASAAGMPISGNFFGTSTPSSSVTCTGTGCAATPYGMDVRGFFAGPAGLRAGLGYNISQTSGTPDLILGVVAYSAANNPTVGAAASATSATSAAASLAGTAASSATALGNTTLATQATTAQTNATNAGNAVNSAVSSLFSATTTGGAGQALTSLLSAAGTAQSTATATTNAANTVLSQAGPGPVAQLSANAALASVNSLNALVTSAGASANTITVSSAISSAQSALTAAQSSVSTVLTATIPTTSADATTAASLAATALSQANAAIAANTAVGAFADSTAAAAKTTLTNANNLVQTTNTAIQAALGTAASSNTTLIQQQQAINTAVASGQAALTSANTVLTALTAQGLQNTTLSAALSQAQTAATAAQTAATQAASLQAAGDITGAQAQATIASQQATIAANVLAAANQILSAVGTTGAVATAVTNIITAGTAAQSALTAANSALTTITSSLGTVTTNAAIVATNAPLTGANNPAVLSSNFSHVVMSQRPVTGGTDEIVGDMPVVGASPTFTSTFTQPNTKYVLDGSKNLIEIRNTHYADSTTGFFSIDDANLKFTGGTGMDRFNDPDGTVYLGRILGGQIAVTDNTAVASPFTMAQGPASTHWIVGLLPGNSTTITNTFGPVNVVQTLIGTANYSTILAATHPTDRQGNVGTLNSASVTANFSAQTVNTALGLSFSTTDPVNISNRNLTLAASTTKPLAFHNGTGFSTSVSTLTANGGGLTCSGDCPTDGYNGIIRGSFIGAATGGAPTGGVSTSLGLGYDIFSFPTSATTPPPANDVIQGVAVLSTGAAPGAGVTNSFANNANVRHEVRYPVTSNSSNNTFTTTIRNSINLTNPTAQTLSGPTTNTNYLFDPSGNLVRIMDTPYVVFDHGTNVAPFAEDFAAFNQPLANSQISFGGTPAQTFFDPVTGLRMGRYSGGDVNVTTIFADGNFGALDSLGNRSAHWVVYQSPTSLPATGIFHYTRVNDAAGNPTFATAPTDSYGNVGTFDAARLTVDFSRLQVSAGLRIRINSGAGGTLGLQNLSGSFSNAPLAANGSFNVSSNPLDNASNTDNFGISCFGPGCAPNQSYGGRIRGSLTSSGAANTAEGAFFRYTFNTNYTDAPTAAANGGRVFDDYIDGMVGFNQGPAIAIPSQAATLSSTTAGPSSVLTTYRYFDSGTSSNQSRTERFRVENAANSSSVFAATPNLLSDASGNLRSVTRDGIIDDEKRGLTIAGGTPNNDGSGSTAPTTAAGGVTLGWYSNSPTLTVSGADFNSNCFGTVSGGCATPARTVLADGVAWVRGPAPYPFYLSEVLSSNSNAGGSVITGLATYAFSGATLPRDQSGNPGSLIGSPTLSVNFNRQSVNFAMSASTNGGANIWSATANNLRLDFGDFSAFVPNSAGQTIQSGTTITPASTHQDLVVTLNSSSANTFGNVQGALMGTGLNAAGVTYSLGSSTSSVSGGLAFSLSDNGNGSGTNLTAPFSVTTDYRLTGLVTGMNPAGKFDSSENTAINGVFVSANREQRVNGIPVKVDGNLPIVVTPNGCTGCIASVNNIPVTFAVAGATGANVPSVGTATVLESGTDQATGITWGRLGSGTIGVNDRINSTPTSLGTIDITNQNVHFISSGRQSGPSVLPTSGTFAYTLSGGTQPTDNFGHVGTLDSASLTANFSTMKVNTAVGLTVFGNTWSASASNLSIAEGSVFGADKSLGSGGGSLTVTSSLGTNTSGQLIGAFTGQTGRGAGLMYSLNQGGNVLDNAAATTVSGVAAFARPGATVAPPPALSGSILTFPNNANLRNESRYLVSPTGSTDTYIALSRNSVNLTVPTSSTLSGPNDNTNYRFDASGNLTGIVNAPYVIFDHSDNVAPTTIFPTPTPLANAQIAFGTGFTFSESFSDTTTGIRLGRWQSGSVNVTDLSTGQTYTDVLGNRSVQWVVAQAPTSLPTTGIFHYTRINDGSGNPGFATAPTDSYGNVGVLDAARLTANFSRMTASAGVRLHINSGPSGALGIQNLSGSFNDAPIQNLGFNVSSNPANNPLNTDFFRVSCVGAGCAPNQTYGGRIRGGFDSATGGANTADGAYFRYTFNTNYPDAATATANGTGRVNDDYIEGLVAFRQGPQIVVPSQVATTTATTAGPSAVLTQYSFTDTFGTNSRGDNFVAYNPANVTSDASGNLKSVTDDSMRDQPLSLTITGGTTTTPIAAANGVTLGEYTTSPALTVSGTGCCDTSGNVTSFTGRTVLPGGLAWVRGPAAFPFYLSEALAGNSNSSGSVITGSATYAFSAATPPRDQTNAAGTFNSASLSVNFNSQAVSFGLNATTGAGTWNASASGVKLDGSEGRFSAHTPNPSGTTVGPTGASTHDTMAVTLTPAASSPVTASGNVQGALMGVGLDAAGMTYALNSGSSSVSGAVAFALSNNGNGSATNLTAPFSIDTTYRLIASATGMNPAGFYDSDENIRFDGGFRSPFRTQTAIATVTNASVASGGTGDTVTASLPIKVDGQFSLVVTQNGCTTNCTFVNQIPAIFAVAGATGTAGPSGTPITVGTAVPVELHTDTSTGITWGRYGSGTLGATDRISGASLGTIDVTSNNVHFLATGNQAGPTVLPTSGSFNYTLVGNTLPTDDRGNVGILNSASLAANFTAQTVNTAVNLTIAGNAWNATATGTPIQNGIFEASTKLTGARNLAVTVTGASVPAGATSGRLIGGFTGQTGTGAGILYSLNKGGSKFDQFGAIVPSSTATTVNGVAVFKR